MIGFGPIGSAPIGASSDFSARSDSRDDEGGSSIFPVSPEIDAVVADLAIGKESQRRAALHRIIEGEFQDRSVLAHALIRALSTYEAQPGGSSSSNSWSDDAHAAARSWLRSGLIWCQPDDPVTEDIAERGLKPNLEPVNFVRFWTLAALVGVKANYLHRMAALSASDPAWDVAFVARAVLSPGSPDLVSEMRLAFDGRDIWKLHGILRALRVVPIPDLAQNLAALLGFQPPVDIPPYDIFCAIATPRMVVPAANILSSSPGLETVVGKMVMAAITIDRTTAQNFARLLAAMDPRRSESLLQEREAIPELRSAARILLDALSAIRTHDAEIFRQLPGFAPDTIEGQADHLDIQAEVNTLTAIMMAKDVKPPLAIGLFGEWGSGKSFFMSRMKKTVKDLIAGPAQAEGSPFCANAVQIHFNAWHYADANLWASLVNSIFENLDGHLRKKDATPDEREILLKELASAQAAQEAARAEEEQASARLKQEQARLAAAAAERESKLGVLSGLQANDFADLLKNDEALKRDAEQALKDLGLPAVINSIGDLSRALAETRSLSRRALAMFMALSRDPAGRKWFAFFVVVMASSPALAYLIHRYVSPDSVILVTISTISPAIAAFVTSATALLRRGTTLVADVLAPLEEAKRKADEKLAQQRKSLFDEEKRLGEKLNDLKKQEEAARTQLDDAVRQAMDVEKRLSVLDQSRTLAYFVAERRASADYSKHLGLVSVVRQDFELLVDRINKNNQDESSEQKLDRIILYIDDLDRCPSNKVVDVLEAVHLLLAYPLFVVVVGVDARWLLNSLTLHYKELGVEPGGTRGRGKDDHIVSPQHYLEKIFQIPYALRPMNRQGYGRLIGQLMGNSTPAAPMERTASSSPPPDAPPEQDHASLLSPPGQSAGMTAAAAQSQVQHATVTAQTLVQKQYLRPKTGDPLPSVVERALVIQPWEVYFAQRLYGLIPSPRSAKRLINVYRVLKAGVDSARLPQFEGVHDAPGEFQLPLLLLAILICDTSEANRWFAELLKQSDRAGSDTLGAILSQGQADAGAPRARILIAVAPIIDIPGFPQDPALLAYWVPRVARFSFHTWHGLMED
jgi:hypothetical protein